MGQGSPHKPVRKPAPAGDNDNGKPADDDTPDPLPAPEPKQVEEEEEVVETAEARPWSPTARARFLQAQIDRLKEEKTALDKEGEARSDRLIAGLTRQMNELLGK